MNNNNNISYKTFLDFLLKGNFSECEKFVHNYLQKNNSFLKLYEDIFKISLYEIGILWETNKISVAIEHIATSIVESLMNELYPKIVSKNNKMKKIVLTCVENENHRVGLKMIADVFESNNWETYNFSGYTPLNDLIDYLKNSKFNLIGISLSIYYNIPCFIKTLKAIRDNSPTTIIIGGQALNKKGYEIEKKFDNVKYINNLTELQKFIDNF